MGKAMRNEWVRFTTAAIAFFAVYLGVGVCLLGEELHASTFLKAVGAYAFVYAFLESRWLKRRFAKTRTDTRE